MQITIKTNRINLINSILKATIESYDPIQEELYTEMFWEPTVLSASLTPEHSYLRISKSNSDLDITIEWEKTNV